MYDIKNAVVKNLYKPWTYVDSNFGQQPAGFLTQFSNHLAFMTVHFAGHEVPAYQPEKAFELFRKYLDGDLFHVHSSSSDSDTSGGTSLAVAVAIMLTLTSVLGVVVCFRKQIKSYIYR